MHFLRQLVSADGRLWRKQVRALGAARPRSRVRVTARRPPGGPRPEPSPTSRIVTFKPRRSSAWASKDDPAIPLPMTATSMYCVPARSGGSPRYWPPPDRRGIPDRSADRAPCAAAASAFGHGRANSAKARQTGAIAVMADLDVAQYCASSTWPVCPGRRQMIGVIIVDVRAVGAVAAAASSPGSRSARHSRSPPWRCAPLCGLRTVETARG